MGGRGGSSGLGRGADSEWTGAGIYEMVSDSMDGLGLGNGGETDRWMSTLTDDQYRYIEDYTGSGYDDINRSLRKDLPMPEYLEREVNGITSAIDNFELKETTVFHRGSTASLLGGAGTLEEIKAMRGQVVVDKGFTSTAATKNHGFVGDEPISYHIKTGPGKGIGAFVQQISSFGTAENEFLFNKGSAFKIVGAYSDYSGVHVNMEYVGRM